MAAIWKKPDRRRETMSTSARMKKATLELVKPEKPCREPSGGAGMEAARDLEMRAEDTLSCGWSS
jgi:hypothetical protein